MNSEIKKLYEIAQKPERRIIGLMSGTSLDGLDIALCNVSGSGKSTSVSVEHFETVNYSAVEKNKIRKIFARSDAPLHEVCLLNKWLGVLHANFINRMLVKWNVSNSEIDLIASHGQTIYHAPDTDYYGERFNSTFQAGDADHIAILTGITTISDFRQKHIAAGGEGAPLALYADYLLFGNTGKDTVLLNIGGMANFTWLPVKGRIISTDTGPGNTLMDVWMERHYNKPMDENAAVATSGKIDDELLNILFSHPFYIRDLPKSCGQETFNLEYVQNAIKKLNRHMRNEDVMATLCALTSKTISNLISKLTAGPFNFIISGGGLHNPLLVQQLRHALPQAELISTDEIFPPDAKEAVLFALLANELVAGDLKTWENAGILPAVRMGKISL